MSEKGLFRMEFTPPDLTGMGDEALDLLEPRAHAAAKEIGKDLQAAFKKEVGRHGAGRDIASRPGEPPMTETKAYWRGFSRRVVKKKRRYVEAQVGNKRWEPWGRWLEYGTKLMQPRPHIRPVIERMRASIERRLSRI